VNDASNDVARWIQEITRRALTEQVHSWQRYTDFIQRIARGELDEQSVREEYMRFSREEGLRYARQLTGLSLSYYNQLVELSRAYNEQFFNQVFKTPASGEAGDERIAQQVEMGLRGALGGEAGGSFVLENKNAESADISFLVDEFRDEKGEHPFRPPLQIQPPRFRLGPRQEIVVHLALPLLPELFAPGHTYTTTVLVRGYEDLELLLRVKVDPPEENGSIRIKTTPAQASPPVSSAATRPNTQDLTSLKGLGKGYARKLRQSDIHTIADLAKADLSEHRQALGANGLRQAERFRWVEQARLVEAGDIAALQALQASLKPESDRGRSSGAV
jgi:predicted flap endonuclease-1-like 5' DNA nuclease